MNFSVSSHHHHHGLHVPYQTQITPPIANGTQIHITGTPNGNRFEVNLKSHHNDIVLHFNPRLNDREVVLNNSQQGAWGREERCHIPFHNGHRFTLVITATDHCFKVSVNGSHLCDFQLRTPLSSAQLLEIKGDINLESAQVHPAAMGGPMGFPHMGVHVSSFVQPTVPSFVQPTVPSFVQPTVPSFGGITFPTTGFGFPSVPSVAPVPSFPMGGGGVPSIQSCRIHVGSRIFVRGVIPHGAKRFELNLLQGHSDSNDIAFHFNPRFDVRTIVKNHRQNGQWGSEENQPFPSYMPLNPGAQIDLQIACHRDKYVVSMNNHPIAEYHHKISPGSVMALQYKGDIQVTSVGQL